MLITLHPSEMARLQQRTGTDYKNALADHESRMRRFLRYYEKWRSLQGAPRLGEQGKSQFSVPYLKWQVFGEWSRMLQAVLGDDAQIVAEPTGPSDQRTRHKVERYMCWRVFKSMKLVDPLGVFLFRTTLFGRSHAFSPYKEERLNGKIWYSGPDFVPLWPDEIVVPAEEPDVRLGIQGFTWVIRRRVVQPQDLLVDMEEGRASQEVERNWDRIVGYAEKGTLRDDLEANADSIKMVADRAEGVTRQYGETARGIVVHEWYGRWRLPKKNSDVALDDWSKRSMRETDIVVTTIPALDDLIISVRNLEQMYTRTPRRRPIVEASLVKDGSYWGPSFGEMCEAIEEELTSNHRSATQAVRLTCGPVVFYVPSSGFNPNTFRMEPGICVPVADTNGVREVQMRADLSGSVLLQQAVSSFGDRVTGVTDQAVGHVTDRPNAPDTARGQLLLAEQGNVRASLDITFIREDLARLVEHIWDLDCEFAPTNQFFRVTEEEAKGLIETRQGGATMTAAEFGGRYDFQLKFATSYLSREAEKQRTLELYALDLQNPLIVSNPRALWVCLNKVHKALGDDNFSDIIPEPPDLGMPKNPREEWAMILQGEDIMPNPADNDDLHLQMHFRQLQDERAAGEHADADAIEKLTAHIIDHQQQIRQKQMMMAMAQGLASTIAQNTAMPGAPGLNAGGGMPMSLQNLQQFLGNINGDGQQTQNQSGGGARPGAGGKPGGNRGGGGKR